ncbi:PD40 domain-containing protein [Candidatus Sumerlaeota bacterium]|nr:PD40 domain-containing protein [Candidatus Sumerlaeota bacterium]
MPIARSRSCCAALTAIFTLAVLLCGPAGLHAGQTIALNAINQNTRPLLAQLGGDRPIDIGEVSAEDIRTVYSIAVPHAHYSPQSTKRIPPGSISEVIYRDLSISGYFKPAADQKYVQEQDKIDQQKEAIEFVEWRALKADFVLKMQYSLDENAIGAKVVLYETAKNIKIFENEYRPRKKDEWRTLAHKISDDVFSAITFKRGVANTQLVFVHSAEPKSTRVKEVFLIDADGANPQRLTRDMKLAATPCWGYNNEEIYYTSDKDFNWDLCGVKISGGEPWFISRQPGFNISPNWNQQTQRIALTLGKDGNSEIYLMDRSGKKLQRLTRHKAIDSSPSFFPNGRQVLFTSNRSGNPQIWMTDSDGLDRRRITFQGSYNDGAVISPKGDKIAISGRSDGVFNIYTLDLDGRNWRQLTGRGPNEGNNEDPTWAPNGELIAFTSDRTGSQQIYVMNADGSNVTRLTDQGANHSPAWSPFLSID